MIVRGPLLVEGFRIHAVRIALHHERPVGEHRQDVGRDADVVAEQVSLGQLQLGPEHFAEVAHVEAIAGRQPQGAAAATVFDSVDLVQELLDRGLAVESRVGSREDPRFRSPWTGMCASPRTWMLGFTVDLDVGVIVGRVLGEDTRDLRMTVSGSRRTAAPPRRRGDPM